MVLSEGSPFDVSLVFRRGSSACEEWGGGEIGGSGVMVVNESIGGTEGAGSLIRGCSGTLNSGDVRNGMPSLSL